MEKVHRHKHKRSDSRRRNNDDASVTEQQHLQNIEEQQQQQNALGRNHDYPAVLVNGHDPNLEENIRINGIQTIDVQSASGAAINDGTIEVEPSSSSRSGRKHHHNESRRTFQQSPHGSPRPPPQISSSSSTLLPERHQVHRGIMGFMDRELKDANATNGSAVAGKKTQSLSDPQASPAQRSTRSRNSLEKSPRRKRSKSESRRRRERKLIAAGEMEVRQANETLMRYLKQVSDMHDASLSGELEIDHNFDERRVHRKTKSQRDKRGLISKTSAGKLYEAGGGLSSILKDLSEDIIPAGREIYNPFTPVVSPTEGPPSNIDKMFIQTASGYRNVDGYYKNQIGSDIESNKNEINNSVNLSCALQRIWIMIANICHGLLGGLALAHLLFVVTSKPFSWSMDEMQQQQQPQTNYLSFIEVYTNTFYFLAIICMVSVFDRMDICHIDLSNASELISFRWIIIAMIYIATIILTLCAETMDDKMFKTNNYNLTVNENEMFYNKILNAWNSLSIARSFGAIIGWIMIGLSPDEDLLYVNLMEMEKYQLTNN